MVHIMRPALYLCRQSHFGPLNRMLCDPIASLDTVDKRQISYREGNQTINLLLLSHCTEYTARLPTIYLLKDYWVVKFSKRPDIRLTFAKPFTDGKNPINFRWQYSSEEFGSERYSSVVYVQSGRQAEYVTSHEQDINGASVWSRRTSEYNESCGI
jgi:hypothetical protein